MPSRTGDCGACEESGIGVHETPRSREARRSVSAMSRFHRVIFHPTRPDTSPHLAPVDRKRHGKHSGHTPPPWVAAPDAPTGEIMPPAPPAPTQRKASIESSATRSVKGGKRATRGSGRKSKP